jgi:hypothetical protein
MGTVIGKALGGSHGGFTTGPSTLVEYLRQKSRPYLFSNTLPPAVVMGSMAALDLLEKDSSLVQRLRENTTYFRNQLTSKGVKVREGVHPIVPIMIGDTAKAISISRELLDRCEVELKIDLEDTRKMSTIDGNIKSLQDCIKQFDTAKDGVAGLGSRRYSRPRESEARAGQGEGIPRSPGEQAERHSDHRARRGGFRGPRGVPRGGQRGGRADAAHRR